MGKLRRVSREGDAAQVKKHCFCHAEIHGAEKLRGNTRSLR
jgi:hypothetical protein